MTVSGSDPIDFLLTRYSQLTQRLSTQNQVIHRTFYLSLVFGVALLSLGFQADSPLQRGMLSVLGAFIFISLGLWTRTYVNGRNETQRQRDKIINELKTHKYDFHEIDGVTAVFPSETKRDRWEEAAIKNKLLYIYYVAVFSSSVIIFAGAII
jgi:hypothetical protein